MLRWQRQIGNRAAALAVQRQPAKDPAVMHPENFPTYEGWLASFSSVTTFDSQDEALDKRGTSVGGPSSHRVLGASNRSDNATATTDPGADPGQHAPFIGPDPGDRFIDHPTDDWVRKNLPAELRETAYRLPANCADIVVILRHVWLFAHRRSESYRGFVVGLVAGEAAGAPSKRVGRDIAAISTATLSMMINPYTDSAGRPLRSIAALAPLLHPGDILLWDHHDGTPLNGPRSGGHSQTVVSIARAGGAVTAVETLQGNEPLPAQAKQFRHTPGRRVERGSSLVPRDVMVPGTGRQPAAPVWTWSDGHTTLVMAGPPKSGQRPAATKAGGVPVRRVADWIPSIATASREHLVGIVEAAFREALAAVEGGTAPAEVEGEARAVATAARNRLAALDAKVTAAGKVPDPVPAADIRRILAELRTGSTSTAPKAAGRVFTLAADAFAGAGRQPGWSGLSATDPNSGERLVGRVRRIPVDGLPGGSPQAILALPAGITGGPGAVDVLLLFHGQNEGYRGGRKGSGSGGGPGDIDPDRIEMQLQDSKRRMLAVLPQGSAKGEFGGLDPGTYLKAAFDALTAMKVWSAAPPRGSIIVAGHSGGGRTAVALETGAPAAFAELALFDGINGPQELADVEAFVRNQLDSAAARLANPGVKNDKDKEGAIIATVPRLRLYHSGSASAAPDRTPTSKGTQPNWPGLHAALRKTLAGWFNDNSGRLSPAAAAELRARIEVLATGERNHHRLVGARSAPGSAVGALQDAIGR